MSQAPGTPSGPLRAVSTALVEGGVREVVLCPGSRSTPLALALRTDARLRCWVHIDERAGAFFALGMAAAGRRPTAIVVTSGTAAVELGPAIVEARYGRLPLIAMTADRPPEARDRGAPQTIDQDHLFGRFAKWYAELPVPAEGEAASTHVRGLVARAVAVSTMAPAGPVHLNAPFREPLVPTGTLVMPADGPEPAAATIALSGDRRLSKAHVERLVDRIEAARHGLIVCGPIDRPGFAHAVTALAAATGFPIVADALSNVRFGPHAGSAVMARADALVRAPGFAAGHRPDLVLRFGGTPTSRALLEWIGEGPGTQVAVDDGGWNEPTGLPVTMVSADPVMLASAIAAALVERAGSVAAASAWLTSWRTADDAAAAATRAWLDHLDEPFEGEVFDVLGSSLPDGVCLLAGNSMPVRDMDAFLGRGTRALRCLGNRGANGIDGLVATALGMAAVADGPVVAVVGDLAFLHDLNALLAVRRHGLSATIVVVNNDGGGIFSFLPQASASRPEVGLPMHFEELFGTPHGIVLGPLVGALGIDHALVTPRELATAVPASIARPGVQILEVRTERARNVALHRDLLATVTRAVDGADTAGARTRLPAAPR